MASIRRATTLLASGTLVSRVLGFGRQWLLVQALAATGFVTDAFNTAITVPNTLFAIVSQGLLNAVLIPQLVRSVKHPDGGQAYINKLVTLGMVVFAGVTVVGTLLSPQLIFLLGLRSQGVGLGIAFSYWLMPQIFFYGLYTLLGEVLNSRGSFGPFTWAPALNNVISIATLVIFLGVFGSRITDVAAWTPLMIAIIAGGYTLGIAAQALVLFAFWRRIGLRFRLDFGWRGMELRSVGKAAGWTFAMLLCTQLAGAFQVHVANTASGANRAGPQALSTTWLIFMLPYSIIAVSVVTAYFTRMASHARDNDMDSFKTDYSSAVRLNVLLISFCAAALMVTAASFSRVFTADYLPLTYVLEGFLVGLVPYVVAFVTLRAFYSLGDTRSPFVYTLMQSVLVAILLSICLMLPVGIRTAGVALSVSIAVTIQAIVSTVVLRRRLHGIDLAHILRTVARGFLAAVVALAAGILMILVLNPLHPRGFTVANPVTAIISMAIIGVVMLVVYVLMLAALRTPELMDAWNGIRRRLRMPGRME